MSNLTELKESGKTIERNEYMRRAKDAVVLMEAWGYDPAMISSMRQKLGEYDVYKQKNPYFCGRCFEQECVCYPAAPEPPRTNIDLPF